MNLNILVSRLMFNGKTYSLQLWKGSDNLLVRISYLLQGCYTPSLQDQ